MELLKDYPLNNYVETKDFEIETNTENIDGEPSSELPLLAKTSNNTSMFDTEGSKLKLTNGVVRIEIETSEGIGSCTGVMLNSTNIATSAHCVDNAINHTNNSITVSDNMITGFVKATIY